MVLRGKSFFSNIDWWLFLPVAFLSLFGVFVLSSVAREFLQLQIIHVVVAFSLFFLFANVSVVVLRGFAPWLYILALLLLVFTEVFGVVTRGSVRWLTLGPLTLQPAELVKPLMLIFFASLVAYGGGLRSFVYLLVFSLPVFVLIMAQPDLGSAIVLASGLAGVVWLGGVSVRILLGFGLVFFLATPILWNFLADYQKERLFSFLNFASDPLDSGYNSIQAMVAVGSGGFLGRGFGQGIQSQLKFLPETHTDFIFAASSEELGFVVAVALVVAFSLILFRLVVICRKSKDLFARSLLGGVFMVVFVQAFVNIGMNMGMLPVTGVPLPFVSLGGSSIASMSVLLGMASGVGKSIVKR